ncbi:MAG: tetratricopeptide repeat protein [Burkholderiaceae bacterium]
MCRVPFLPMQKAVAAAAMLFAMAGGALAEPYVPTDGSTVLEHLPSRNDPAQQNLRRLRARLDADPNNLDVAVELSRAYINVWHDGGDPRYLGYAQHALKPWWSLPDPPLPARVMRATLLQSTHQFQPALADLDAVVRSDPDDAQAWLTRATILQVLGRYPQAEASCAKLNGQAAPLVVLTCVAGVRSLSGHAQEAYLRLDRAMPDGRGVDPAIFDWTSTLLAEMAERLGKPKDAERHFRAALAADPSDNYLLAAYSDFLLKHDRPREVVSLLDGKSRIDTLLLRYAIALKQTGSPDAARYRDMLKQRFDAAVMRGDTIHRREQARFELDLMNDPAQALKVALLNWEVQKEPADVLILLRAAAAAGDRQAARPVLAWLDETGLEDTRLRAPLDKLGKPRG